MKWLPFAVVVLAVFWLLSGESVIAQTPEEDNVKTVLETLFQRLGEGDLEEIEELLARNVEVFDSTYPLRIDGLKPFQDYLADQWKSISEFRTSVRQPTVQILGTVAVANFYYSKDHVGKGAMAKDEEPVMWIGTREIGRGTVVFVKDRNTWKGVTIHLSEFPAPAYY